MKWTTSKKLPEISKDIQTEVEYLNDSPKTITFLRDGKPFLRFHKPESYGDSLSFSEPTPPKTKEVFFVRGSFASEHPIVCGPFSSQRDAAQAAHDLGLAEDDVNKEVVLDEEAS